MTQANPTGGDERLLEEYVSSFEKLGCLGVYEGDPASVALASQGDDGLESWWPARIVTDKTALATLYSKLPFRFPPLYEKLVLTFRWAQVNLDGYQLLANPPGTGLDGLLDEILRDKHLHPTIFKHGYIQFARGKDCDYDPICFDSKRRRGSGDCPVVKLDHEEILCNEKLVVVKELAPSFRKLVLQTILAAEQRREA